jgi:hypothetical protein
VSATAGKSGGRQRTQYATLDDAPFTVPDAVATMAAFSSTLTETRWLAFAGDAVGSVSALVAPGEAVMETWRAFVPAAHRT